MAPEVRTNHAIWWPDWETTFHFEIRLQTVLVIDPLVHRDRPIEQDSAVRILITVDKRGVFSCLTRTV